MLKWFNNQTGALLPIVLLLVTLIGIPVAVYLAMNPQIFNPKANVSTHPVLKTSMELTSPKQIYEVGQEFIVWVKVTANIDNANLFVAQVDYPKDKLEALTVVPTDQMLAFAQNSSSSQSGNIQNSGQAPPCQTDNECAPNYICLKSSDATESAGVCTFNDPNPPERLTFIKTWVERNINSQNGTISIIGGNPNPGYKTGAQPEIMAGIIFKAKQSGPAEIKLAESSAIYRNSDNQNILTSTTNLTVQLQSGSSTGEYVVKGYVYNDFNENKTRDQGETGIQGVFIRFKGDDTIQAETDASGYFTITEPGSIGEKTIIAQVPGGYFNTTPTTIVINNSNIEAEQLFGLKLPGSTNPNPSPAASSSPSASALSCQTLGSVMYTAPDGSGYIGCDVKITGNFDLNQSYCIGTITNKKEYLYPDSYGRENWYYATLGNLDTKEEVKVYAMGKDGQAAECTPSLNKTSNVQGVKIAQNAIEGSGLYYQASTPMPSPTPIACTLYGDFNNDKVVDSKDLALLLASSNSDMNEQARIKIYDINGDGVITQKDIIFLLDNFAADCVEMIVDPKPDDQKITILDFTTFFSKFGHDVDPSDPSDLNSDGKVNTIDFFLLLKKWNN